MIALPTRAVQAAAVCARRCCAAVRLAWPALCSVTGRLGCVRDKKQAVAHLASLPHSEEAVRCAQDAARAAQLVGRCGLQVLASRLQGLLAQQLDRIGLLEQ